MVLIQDSLWMALNNPLVMLFLGVRNEKIRTIEFGGWYKLFAVPQAKCNGVENAGSTSLPGHLPQ